MALDMEQVNKMEIVYIDDRLMFVDIAKSLGIKGIYYINKHDTFKQLAIIGLEL